MARQRAPALWVYVSLCWHGAFSLVQNFDAVSDRISTLENDQQIPVVTVWFAQSIDVDHYLWAGLCATLRAGNVAHLLTTATSILQPLGMDLPGLRVINMSELKLRPSHAAFLKAYRPMGLVEPYEVHNTERYYYVLAHMEKEALSHVFHADTDVAVLRQLSITTLPSGCSGIVQIGGKKNIISAHATDWSNWAGSGILSRDMLAEFAEYVPRLYKPEHIGALQFKRKTKPYVTDMTFWYMFTVSSDPSFDRQVAWNHAQFPLPKVNATFKICSGQPLGFDHMNGHIRSTLATSSLTSVHFRAKGDMADWLQCGVAPISTKPK